LGVGCSTLDNLVLKASVAVRRELSSDQQRIRQLEREVSHLKKVNEVVKKAHVCFVGNPSR
jgi:transposase